MYRYKHPFIPISRVSIVVLTRDKHCGCRVSAGRDLFERVIVQSGSALSPRAMMYNPLPTTEAVAVRVNCSLSDDLDGSTLRLLHCLKQVR